jgi:K+ transporter
MPAMYKADSIIPEMVVTPDIESTPEAIKEKIKADGVETELEPHSYGETKPASLDAHGWTLAHLCFQALGVVYGDIGTSPLYVLNGIFNSDEPAPSEEDVIGVISTIVWIFTIVVIFKYALIVLQHGTGMGEGGTFALYQALFPKAMSDDIRDDTTYGVLVG